MAGAQVGLSAGAGGSRADALSTSIHQDYNCLSTFCPDHSFQPAEVRKLCTLMNK